MMWTDGGRCGGSVTVKHQQLHLYGPVLLFDRSDRNVSLSSDFSRVRIPKTLKISKKQNLLCISNPSSAKAAA